MARMPIVVTVQKQNGSIVPGATVTVYEREVDGGQGDLATIYAGPTGGDPSPNPITVNATTSMAIAWAEPGPYSAVVTAGDVVSVTPLPESGVGPAGAKGDTGATGPTGPAGSDGADGADATSIVIPNPRAESYTLTLADVGRAVDMDSASATVVTVPGSGSVAFPVGATIEICRIGTGPVTITPESGVVIPNRLDAAGTTPRAIPSQYSAISIRQRATDVWVLVGDIS